MLPLAEAVESPYKTRVRVDEILTGIIDPGSWKRGPGASSRSWGAATRWRGRG